MADQKHYACWAPSCGRRTFLSVMVLIGTAAILFTVSSQYFPLSYGEVGKVTKIEQNQPLEKPLDVLDRHSSWEVIESLSPEPLPANETSQRIDEVFIAMFPARSYEKKLALAAPRSIPCSTKCRFAFSDALQGPPATHFLPTFENLSILKEEQRQHMEKLLATNPNITMSLMTSSEAPPCRQFPEDICQQFDYKVALASGPNVAVELSFAPTSIPPIEAGWYNKPTYCLQPEDCIGGAIMSCVASPTKLEWERRKNLTATTNPKSLQGYDIRGYWAWEISNWFPVINFSSRAWFNAQTSNTTHLDTSRCFPPEAASCREQLRKCEANEIDCHKTVPRSPAGKPWQGVSKIFMGSAYKFTLAIENKIVGGYITEKFYQGFLSRTLMVYCGAPDAKDYAPGYHSYVDCHDFANAQELASYLMYLDTNHTAYLEFFEWKKYPLREEFVGTFQRSPLDKIGTMSLDHRRDMSVDWLDSKTWNQELDTSLVQDEGWPSSAMIDMATRAKDFKIWGSAGWKKQRNDFVLSRFESSNTWICELCKHHLTTKNSAVDSRGNIYK